MRTYRYFEWTTAPASHPSGDRLVEALADSLTEDGDITRGIQTLRQRGMSAADNKMQGLREMLEQLRKRKQQRLDKYDLNSLLNDIRKQLDTILQHERQAVEERLQQAQAFQQLLEELQRRARSSQLNGQPASNELSTADAGDSWEDMYDALNRQ